MKINRKDFFSIAALAILSATSCTNIPKPPSSLDTLLLKIDGNAIRQSGPIGDDKPHNLRICLETFKRLEREGAISELSAYKGYQESEIYPNNSPNEHFFIEFNTPEGNTYVIDFGDDGGNTTVWVDSYKGITPIYRPRQ